MQTPHSIPHFIIVQLYLSLCCLTRPGIKMRQPQSSISENCDILWSMGFLRVQYWNKGGFNIVAPDCPTSQHSKQDGWDGLQYIYVYIPPKKKSSLYQLVSCYFHVMHGLILFAYFPPKGGSEDLSQHCCLCRADGRQLWALTHTLENGRKISGQDVPKDATRCNTLLDLLVLLQYIPRSWLGDWHRPLDNICWFFLQWSSTCEYQKHIENGLLTSPKIKKALIMISPYQSNQIHQIHGCLWHELLQCFLREPWRPDHTITSEGNPKLDLVKREASFQSFVLLHWELKILEQFWASIHSPNKDTSWKFITQFSREICIKWLFWFIWPLSWS